MLTLQKPQSETKADLHHALMRLGSSMARAAVETAGAFFCSEAALDSGYPAGLRYSDLGAMRCSQRNVGGRHEMLCNLTVDAGEWDRLFGARESDEIKRDALCELANCICGAVLADPGFTDQFGYLNPCVPVCASAKPAAGAWKLTGALKLGGALIRFSFAFSENVLAVSGSETWATATAAAAA